MSGRYAHGPSWTIMDHHGPIIVTSAGWEVATVELLEFSQVLVIFGWRQLGQHLAKTAKTLH